MTATTAEVFYSGSTGNEITAELQHTVKKMSRFLSLTFVSFHFNCKINLFLQQEKKKKEKKSALFCVDFHAAVTC